MSIIPTLKINPYADMVCNVAGLGSSINNMNGIGGGGTNLLRLLPSALQDHLL